MKAKKWICNDISLSGESLILNAKGRLIAEVYNKKNVNLIKSAPDLLEVLKKMVFEFDNNSENDIISLSLIKKAKEVIKATGQ